MKNYRLPEDPPEEGGDENNLQELDTNEDD